MDGQKAPRSSSSVVGLIAGGLVGLLGRLVGRAFHRLLLVARPGVGVEAIWPGREPEKGRTLLRTALSETFRVLEPNRHRGEPSRFVAVDGDRVIVDATCDVRALRAATGSASEVFGRVKPGLSSDLPDADRVDELRREVDRLRVEAAERVMADGTDGGAREESGDRIGALETLFETEPWNRAHVDALVGAHRAAGDDVAARAVERRWFEDD